MKRKLKLVISLAAVVLLILVVAIPILWPKPIKVETARAVRGPLLVTVDGEGKTRVRDRFTVTAPVTGLLRRIALRHGDEVNTGQTIAIIAPAPWGGQPTLGQEQTGVAQSAVVLAPARGRVLRVLEENERVVAAGTPLLELSNTAKLEVVIDVLSTDAVQIKPGDDVLVESWGGDKTLKARVRLVEPSARTKVSALGIEEQRVNVVADFVDAPAQLGDGYRVEAHIIVWRGDGVLKIPLSALFRRAEGWSVFVVESGRARQRDVEIGRRAASEVEIVRGIEEGAEVILHPANQLADGVSVEAQRGEQ